jgi:hypothetical protein
MKQLCIGTAVLGTFLIGAPVLAYAQMAVDREAVFLFRVGHFANVCFWHLESVP